MGYDVTGQTVLKAKDDRGTRVRCGCVSQVRLVQLGEGNKQDREGGKDGVQSSRNLGEDGDQPFSFTVGDPGSLWGGITCRKVNRRDEIIGNILATLGQGLQTLQMITAC